MKTLKHIAFLTLLLNSYLYSAFAQDTIKKTSTREERKTMKAADVAKLINSKTFTFHAQYANPLGGGMMSLNGQLINISPTGSGHIYLNYNYDVRIKPDSVIAFLPYYGRTTFDPPVNSNDNGVKFTSTKFGYNTKTKKKGNTVITITPTDAKYNRKLILDVTPSGTASLQIIITNRNSISYDGYIEEK